MHCYLHQCTCSIVPITLLVKFATPIPGGFCEAGVDNGRRVASVGSGLECKCRQSILPSVLTMVVCDCCATIVTYMKPSLDVTHVSTHASTTMLNAVDIHVLDIVTSEMMQ